MESLTNVVFNNYNANPKGRKAGDCVVRAITVALGEKWTDVYWALAELGLKHGYMPNDKECFKRYLKLRGYEMRKMPRRADRTRYTVAEFIRELADPDGTYLISVANHLTCVKRGVLTDTWNCGGKSVGNYWIIED